MADAPMTREERLAARLRDNLRRRKDQARARSDGNVATPPSPPIPIDVESPEGEDRG